MNSLLSIVDELKVCCGRSLNSARKPSDLEIYEFCFGNRNEELGKVLPTNYIIHALCPIKLIFRKEKRSVVCYDDLSSEEFNSLIEPFLGKTVRRVGLSDKNDLWFDFEDKWLVVVTNEDDEESWRGFLLDSDEHHLVVSYNWIRKGAIYCTEPHDKIIMQTT